MDLKNKKPEDFMYDSSDAEWSEESTSDYWKRIEERVVKRLGLKPVMAMDGRWITIGHRDPNPEEDDEGRKGRHVYLDDGETPEEAIEELKDGGEGQKKEKKEEKEEKKEKEPAPKPEKDTENKEKTNEAQTELSKLSDEELSKRKNEIYEKWKERKRDEDFFVESDEQMKKYKEEYRSLYKESFFARSDKLAELDKKMDSVKSKMAGLEYDLREEYRKKNGDHHKIYEEYQKCSDEQRMREKRYEEDFDKKVDELRFGINEKNVGERFNEVVKMQEGLGRLDPFVRMRMQKDIDEKLNKPIVDTLADSMYKNIGKYKQKTDKFVEGLSDYKKEYNEAVEALNEVKTKENDAFKRWINENNDELKQKYREELDAVKSQFNEAIERKQKAEKGLSERVTQMFKESLGDTGAKIEVKKSKKGSVTADFYDRVSSLLDGVIGSGVSTKDAPNIKKTTALRSYFNESKGISISGYDKSDGTKIHEFCHFLEHKNPRMLLNSKAFLKYRTKGEPLISMNQAENTRGYGSHEKTRKDKFFKSYCGKVYSLNGEYYSADATEIMSMGLERIFENPVEFAKEDREYFDFVIANIRGDI